MGNLIFISADLPHKKRPLTEYIHVRSELEDFVKLCDSSIDGPCAGNGNGGGSKEIRGIIISCDANTKLDGLQDDYRIGWDVPTQSLDSEEALRAQYFYDFCV